MPVNFDLIASLQAAEGAAAQMAALRLQMDAARVQSPVAVCCECDQPATLFCEQCDDDLCAAHSSSLHSRKKFESHAVVAIAEKAALMAAVAVRPLHQLESRVLPPASEATLLQLFGNLSVGGCSVARHKGRAGARGDAGRFDALSTALTTSSRAHRHVAAFSVCRCRRG